MNDREAIKNAIETFRYYAPMASTVYNDCNASDEFYNAADDLEEILREREECSKVCYACDGIHAPNTLDGFLRMGYKLCPMCGRKLKEEA